MVVKISARISILLVLLFLSSNIVNATADFSETFDDDDLSMWEISAWNSNIANPTIPTFTVSEGHLVSTGQLRWNSINTACMQTGLDQGYFRYDLFVPEGKVQIFGFRLIDDQTYHVYHPLEDPAYTTLIQAVVTMGVRNVEPRFLLGQLKVNETYFSGSPQSLLRL